jgi:hypothetical protein
MAEDSIPGFKAVEDIAQRGSSWLEKNVPGILAGAKDLAKKVTKEVGDAKKKVDQTYNDIINKMKMRRGRTRARKASRSKRSWFAKRTRTH